MKTRSMEYFAAQTFRHNNTVGSAIARAKISSGSFQAMNAAMALRRRRAQCRGGGADDPFELQQKYENRWKGILKYSHGLPIPLTFAGYQ